MYSFKFLWGCKSGRRFNDFIETRTPFLSVAELQTLISNSSYCSAILLKDNIEEGLCRLRADGLCSLDILRDDGKKDKYIFGNVSSFFDALDSCATLDAFKNAGTHKVYA